MHVLIEQYINNSVTSYSVNVALKPQHSHFIACVYEHQCSQLGYSQHTHRTAATVYSTAPEPQPVTHGLELNLMNIIMSISESSHHSIERSAAVQQTSVNKGTLCARIRWQKSVHDMRHYQRGPNQDSSQPRCVLICYSNSVSNYFSHARN